MKKSPLAATFLAALIIATMAIAGVIATRPLAESGQSQANPTAELSIPF